MAVRACVYHGLWPLRGARRKYPRAHAYTVECTGMHAYAQAQLGALANPCGSRPRPGALTVMASVSSAPGRSSQRCSPSAFRSHSSESSVKVLCTASEQRSARACAFGALGFPFPCDRAFALQADLATLYQQMQQMETAHAEDKKRWETSKAQEVKALREEYEEELSELQAQIEALQ